MMNLHFFPLSLVLIAQFAISACDPGSSSSIDESSAVGGTGNTGGQGPTVPANCEPVDPSLENADADELFSYPHVPTFDFYLPEADWQALQKNARQEQYTDAQLCFEGKLVGTVGLRFKGYYGSLYNCFDAQDQMICARLSMKAKFSEYDSDLRFFGLKRLNFNAYRFDDSRMKERLTYDLYRAMGIAAPRASWAVLRVNGVSQGLYGMVEQVDGRFTADRWPDSPDGNLYKEVWPTLATPSQALADLTTNEDQADVSAFVAFADSLQNATDDAQVLQILDDNMGLDSWARYMAVDDAVVNYDGITYFWTDGVNSNNHNFYFYERAPDKFVLIPWDEESTFWIDAAHAAPHWTQIQEDCSLTYPYWDGLARAPACDPIFHALAGVLDGWRAAAQELLDGPFSVENMTQNIDRFETYIGAEAHVDPTPYMYGTFDSAVQNLRNSVPAQRDRLERLMAGEY